MICAVGVGVALSERLHGMGNVDPHTRPNLRRLLPPVRENHEDLDTKNDVEASTWYATHELLEPREHYKQRSMLPCTIVAELQDKVERCRREPQRTAGSVRRH